MYLVTDRCASSAAAAVVSLPHHIISTPDATVFTHLYQTLGQGGGSHRCQLSGSFCKVFCIMSVFKLPDCSSATDFFCELFSVSYSCPARGGETARVGQSCGLSSSLSACGGQQIPSLPFCCRAGELASRWVPLFLVCQAAVCNYAGI